MRRWVTIFLTALILVTAFAVLRISIQESETTSILLRFQPRTEAKVHGEATTTWSPQHSVDVIPSVNPVSGITWMPLIERRTLSQSARSVNGALEIELKSASFSLGRKKPTFVEVQADLFGTPHLMTFDFDTGPCSPLALSSTSWRATCDYTKLLHHGHARVCSGRENTVVVDTSTFPFVVPDRWESVTGRIPPDCNTDLHIWPRRLDDGKAVLPFRVENEPVYGEGYPDPKNLVFRTLVQTRRAVEGAGQDVAGGGRRVRKTSWESALDLAPDECTRSWTLVVEASTRVLRLAKIGEKMEECLLILSAEPSVGTDVHLLRITIAE